MGIYIDLLSEWMHGISYAILYAKNSLKFKITNVCVVYDFMELRNFEMESEKCEIIERWLFESFIQ